MIHGVGQNNELPKSVPGYAPLSYITNMADMYIASDLVISRGGAVTCAELDAANSYALIVPLPIGNGEQSFNANSLVSQGRAEVLQQNKFTSAWLSSNINRLLSLAGSAADTGSDSDVLATEKIVNYMQHALKSRVR